MLATVMEVERWRRAVQQGWFGVWDLDARQDTVHYSPRWKEHLGFPYARSADHTAFWRCRVHPEDQAAMLTALRAHLDGSEPSYEARFRLRSNGSGYRQMFSRGLVLERDAQGEAVRVVGTMIDLSERPASPTPAQWVEDAAGAPGVGISATPPFHQLLGDARAAAPSFNPSRMLDRVGDLLDQTLRQALVRA
ncbi:hypothetical protein C1O66_15465 [Paucibacter aquatile]|uniref:PAS fold-3 domain-containing protein n=1 Tax=Kinneretia aquatilis TaxID=2070761 RepID=A0A2N8KZ93_9BURK|nr:PAS domain-containing protein [Paucibacter aquatile]OYU25531.1 MAG: hypothetical protein CFE41_20835 [Burkholderiales bacterium PBB2]PND38783.1 hypothetical protein C1O66_15465 [Paucibacter aquatile]